MAYLRLFNHLLLKLRLMERKRRKKKHCELTKNATCDVIIDTKIRNSIKASIRCRALILLAARLERLCLTNHLPFNSNRLYTFINNSIHQYTKQATSIVQKPLISNQVKLYVWIATSFLLIIILFKYSK